MPDELLRAEGERTLARDPDAPPGAATTSARRPRRPGRTGRPSSPRRPLRAASAHRPLRSGGAARPSRPSRAKRPGRTCRPTCSLQPSRATRSPQSSWPGRADPTSRPWSTPRTLRARRTLASDEQFLDLRLPEFGELRFQHLDVERRLQNRASDDQPALPRRAPAASAEDIDRVRDLRDALAISPRCLGAYPRERENLVPALIALVVDEPDQRTKRSR